MEHRPGTRQSFGLFEPRLGVLRPRIGNHLIQGLVFALANNEFGNAIPTYTNSLRRFTNVFNPQQRVHTAGWSGANGQLAGPTGQGTYRIGNNYEYQFGYRPFAGTRECTIVTKVLENATSPSTFASVVVLRSNASNGVILSTGGSSGTGVQVRSELYTTSFATSGRVTSTTTGKGIDNIAGTWATIALRVTFTTSAVNNGTVQSYSSLCGYASESSGLGTIEDSALTLIDRIGIYNANHSCEHLYCWNRRLTNSELEMVTNKPYWLWR